MSAAQKKNTLGKQGGRGRAGRCVFYRWWHAGPQETHTGRFGWWSFSYLFHKKSGVNLKLFKWQGILFALETDTETSFRFSYQPLRIISARSLSKRYIVMAYDGAVQPRIKMSPRDVTLLLLYTTNPQAIPATHHLLTMAAIYRFPPFPKLHYD